MYVFPLTHLHTIPPNDRVKAFIEKNEIQKYLIYISFHTLESIHVRIIFGSDYSCESFW
jgi:hypothetical protein